MGWLLLTLTIATLASWLPIADPFHVDLGRALQPPGASNWLGTDELGRDLLARLIHAARSTLWITGLATCLTVSLGAILGITAGWFGGWADRSIGVTINLLWTIPLIVFAILVVAVVGASVTSLVVTIGLTNWVTSARIFRAESARLREQEFIKRAAAYGFGRWSIASSELLPNLAPLLWIVAAFAAVEVLTIETGLAFLGLSLPPPSPTWGGLLAEGLSYSATAWWLVAGCAGAITLTLVCLQAVSRRWETTRL